MEKEKGDPEVQIELPNQSLENQAQTGRKKRPGLKKTRPATNYEKMLQTLQYNAGVIDTTDGKSWIPTNTDDLDTLISGDEKFSQEDFLKYNFQKFIEGNLSNKRANKEQNDEYDSNRNLFKQNDNNIDFPSPRLMTYKFPVGKLGIKIIGAGESNPEAPPSGLVWEVEYGDEYTGWKSGIQPGWLLTHVNGKFIFNNDGLMESSLPSLQENGSSNKIVELTFDTAPFWRDDQTKWEDIYIWPDLKHFEKFNRKNSVEPDDPERHEILKDIRKLLTSQQENGSDKNSEKPEKAETANQRFYELAKKHTAARKKLYNKNANFIKKHMSDVNYRPFFLKNDNNRKELEQQFIQWITTVFRKQQMNAAAATKLQKLTRGRQDAVAQEAKASLQLKLKKAKEGLRFGKILEPYRKYINGISNKGLVFETKFGSRTMKDNSRGLYIKAEGKKFYLHRWK